MFVSRPILRECICLQQMSNLSWRIHTLLLLVKMRLSLHMLILYSPKSACKCISISQGTCVADWMTSMMMHAHGNSDDHIVTMTRANPKVSTRNRCVHDRTWGRNQHVLHDPIGQANTKVSSTSRSYTNLWVKSNLYTIMSEKLYKHQRQNTEALQASKAKHRSRYKHQKP